MNASQKTQLVRLIDVFVLGPFMILASAKLRDPLYRNGLLLSGLATIVYNGRNYLRNLT